MSWNMIIVERSQTNLGEGEEAYDKVTKTVMEAALKVGGKPPGKEGREEGGKKKRTEKWTNVC